MTRIIHHDSSAAESEAARLCIYKAINDLDQDIWKVNNAIHSQPELCYEEFHAYETITSLLTALDISFMPHAYGIETSFSAEYGSGGRLVTFCAEYDALPDIGHACGHNLIAASSLAAFLGVVEALKATPIPGRVRLLGTPAEEGGGGKIRLINAGAFADVDASLMIHPTSHTAGGTAGVAYHTCLAGGPFKVTFTGKPAHAGANPWDGVNALDAAAVAYAAVGLLRQQILPSDRINISIVEGGKKCNIITSNAVVECAVRSKNIRTAVALQERLYQCFRGAAMATGCKVEISASCDVYAELRPNETLNTLFTDAMADLGKIYINNLADRGSASYGTDMGNVSHIVPTFHGCFALDASKMASNHTPEFTTVGGTRAAHDLAMGAAKGMAVSAWHILANDKVAEAAWADFQLDKAARETE